jgi:hypothetical protein
MTEPTIQNQVKEILHKFSADIREDFGEMRGEFKGLKYVIDSKTDECKSNYISLSEHMRNLTNKIKRVEIHREEKANAKKWLFSNVTIACAVIGTIIAVGSFVGYEKNSSSVNKTEKKLIIISKELDKLKIKKETGE